MFDDRVIYLDLTVLSIRVYIYRFHHETKTNYRLIVNGKLRKAFKL